MVLEPNSPILKNLKVIPFRELASFKRPCEHIYLYKDRIIIDNIVYDIYYCQKCLNYVKKSRPCPNYLEDIQNA